MRMYGFGASAAQSQSASLVTLLFNWCLVTVGDGFSEIHTCVEFRAVYVYRIVMNLLMLNVLCFLYVHYHRCKTWRFDSVSFSVCSCCSLTKGVHFFLSLAFFRALD